MKIVKGLLLCILLFAVLACVSRPKFVPTVESSEEYRIEYSEEESSS